MAILQLVILAQGDCDHVSGEYLNGARLEPRPMDNKAAMAAAGDPYTAWSGEETFYILNTRVEADPNFAAVGGYIAALPHVFVDTDIIFLPPPEDC